MTDFWGDLFLVLAVIAAICAVLVLAYAPLEWLADRSARFAAALDRTVERVL